MASTEFEKDEILDRDTTNVKSCISDLIISRKKNVEPAESIKFLWNVRN